MLGAPGCTTGIAAALMHDVAHAGLTTVLCSESVWWRCHRRMIADFVVLSAQVPVFHLMHDGQLHEHRPTEVARLRSDGLLVYDGAAPQRQLTLLPD